MRTTSREELHNVILDAAERLMARYGFKKTSVDDLAREAGIGKGTIYLHFASKEDVAMACIERVNAAVRARLTQIARGPGSPSERIGSMLVERVMLRTECARMWAQSIDEIASILRISFEARRARLAEQEARIFAELLIEGALLGAFSCQDADATAHTLLLATSGLMPSNLGARERCDRAEIEERAGRVARLLLDGLLARPAAEAAVSFSSRAAASAAENVSHNESRKLPRVEAR
jgi:AcrR family transcriptional regulator